MELDDLKNTWDDMTARVTEKQQINLNMFNSMSNTKFRAGLNKIKIPEIAGAVICLGAAVFIGFSFNKFNTSFYRAAGILAILLLVILPAISLYSIHLLYSSGGLDKPYADTLKVFAVQKIRFCKLQKLNFTLSYLLLATVIFLTIKIFGHGRFEGNDTFFITSFGIGYIFLLYVSKWVFKKYNRVIGQTEVLLKELAS